MIAAMANNRVIGANNTMPWHLPGDLKHFKKTTVGKPIIMGRKTYESIGFALPGRLNIVLSSNADYSLTDASTVTSCEQALQLAQAYFNSQDISIPEVMIIGGGTIYRYFLPYCQTLYLTQIMLDVQGDTYFPDYRAQYTWHQTSQQSHKADDNNAYDYEFMTLVKQAEPV